MKKLNKYYIYQDIVFVKYSNCDEYFICDLEDWEKLKDYTWWAKTTTCGKYACAWVNGYKKRFHRLVMEAPLNMQVDHIHPVSSGVCDNRKSNLRLVTNQQNSMNCGLGINNKSGHKGICFDKYRSKWIANIKVNYKTIYLGRFTNLEDAIKAREEAEIKYFGEYRRVI